MNFFGDAIRFFTNLNKEASAKHILIKASGSYFLIFFDVVLFEITIADGDKKLELVKAEINAAEDKSETFSQLATKVFV